MEYKVEVLEKAVKTYGYVHQTIKAAEDLRAKYQALVAEKDKNSGDAAETYTTGYRYGHRNGQIELLQQILGICDGVSEPEETNE